MTREDALEILNRKVVVEVVIVIDGRLIQGIRGTELDRANLRGGNRLKLWAPLRGKTGREPAA